MPNPSNPFGAESSLKTLAGDVRYFDLSHLQQEGVGQIDRLPLSIKVLLESCLRNVDGFAVHAEDVKRLAGWGTAAQARPSEIPFKPYRVLLQDFTGVPCVVDLAAMRSAMKRAGGDEQRINPLVPVDLVIDHSVQVDEFGTNLSLLHNATIEFSRNRERYEFLKWGQKAFRNFSVVPPATGIVHQVNLEYLAKVVALQDGTALPDSLVGTDSHTTMVNGLGVVGWGVGGIEAEACMLGQPIYMLTPQVLGFELTGRLREGCTATDLVLFVTQMLRKHGVVDKFVEFFGPGLASMSVADRATIANMAPEYGATIGFFPVDDQVLSYLRLTGRDTKQIDLVERYCKEQGLWRNDAVRPQFTETISLDISTVEPSLAGPKRPQDRVALPGVRTAIRSAFASNFSAAAPSAADRIARFAHEPKTSVIRTHVETPGATAIAEPSTQLNLRHGDVVIAAITSCTNTSNPSVMVAAGLLAKNAVEEGLKVPSHVKTSLSPGSRVVTDYFDKADLTRYLDALGFATTGYGCMTCIGNSGPLLEAVAADVEENNLVVASVLSGNRNFEGRINAHVKANFLASPPLVVAFALAGTVDADLAAEPLGNGKDGRPVFLRDIWPTQQQVNDVIASCISPDMFRKQYDNIGGKNQQWNDIAVRGGNLYDFDPASTYIQEPPFFTTLQADPEPITAIKAARVLAMVGDSVTTDHISPAGSIMKDSPAGKYLIENGVEPRDFNSYGARRGNDRVMTRGTFANIRLKNLLAPGTEGGLTTCPPGGKVMPIYDAAEEYRKAGTPLIVLAGKDYGMGSSRDWAAKGVVLLGVRAAIAESYERIHRSNLVFMGVLPLQFMAGQTRATLGLTGAEAFDIAIDERLSPGQSITVTATTAGQPSKKFETLCRIDGAVEIEYYRNGGILQTVLRKMLRGS